MSISFYMGTFTQSGMCLLKAGANVNDDFHSGAVTTTGNVDINTSDKLWNILISGAESFINVATRYNWTDAYSTLNGDVKYVLEQAASAWAAIMAIQYDMGDYNTRGEAESMINILRDDFLRCISILRDKKQQDFINGA